MSAKRVDGCLAAAAPGLTAPAAVPGPAAGGAGSRDAPPGPWLALGPGQGQEGKAGGTRNGFERHQTE